MQRVIYFKNKVVLVLMRFMQPGDVDDLVKTVDLYLLNATLFKYLFNVIHYFSFA